MTKDEIIELAKQAGFADGVVEIVGLYGFMKFAELVAAAEREREACEEICVANGALGLAAAIRARGNT